MTQLNPNFDVFGIKGLPQYACPDLSNRGTSWVFPITDPCGSAQRQRRLRKERFTNGVKIAERCYIDDVNDDDEDDDDSDSDYELKSTGEL